MHSADLISPLTLLINMPKHKNNYTKYKRNHMLFERPSSLETKTTKSA